MRASAAWRLDDVPLGGVEHFALDALAIGIIVTDANARLHYANTTAARFLNRPDGALRRIAGRIVASDVKANASLMAAIGRVCRPRMASVRPQPAAVEYLMAPSPIVGGPNAAVRVLSMRAEEMPCQAMIFLREIERICNLESEARDLFGLTGAEAKFASAIASGLSVAEAAAAQGVSVATARAHLSRIFQKTGTRQQSQVAALLRGAQIPVDSWFS